MWLYTFIKERYTYIYIHTINSNIIKKEEYGWFVQCTVTHTQIYTSTNINNFNKQQ